MMRFKLYRLVKSVVVITCSAVIFAIINTLIAGNVDISSVEELSPPVKHGAVENRPNGVRVIKRSLMQNRSADEPNAHGKSVNEESHHDGKPRNISILVAKDGNRTTELEDIYISVKTTQKFHNVRVKLMLETWWLLAQEQTYFFTDDDDAEYQQLTRGHMINTNCSNMHNRRALCCKMSIEFDYFIQSGKRWFCHVDDDTYVNVPRLVSLVQGYDHTKLWYLGKPSLSHPIETRDPERAEQRIAFWFATGGAGMCVSRGLALNIMPYASGGKLARVCDKIRLPDDCTLGYIITKLSNVELTVIPYFHSHLEGLWSINSKTLHDQITLSYGSRQNKMMNVVSVDGMSVKADPTRIHSIHCFLHPYMESCKRQAAEAASTQGKPQDKS